MQTYTFDIVIIGAGAAGLMCGQLASQRGWQVAILDHSAVLAEKIRISGGGRCNFTNLNVRAEAYLSANPHFARSALSRYTPQHFTQLLDQHAIGYHEKTLGQLFCNQKSQAIIDLLDDLGHQHGVTRWMATKIERIENNQQQFEVISSRGKIRCNQLVVACGGLSIPQIGATGFGYQLAQQFGHNLILTAPALVPLTLEPADLDRLSSLSGVSFFSQTGLTNAKIKFEENTLITHRGLSGPAILQISSYWQGGNRLTIDMLPGLSISSLIEEQRSSNKLLANYLSQFFSQRLADSLIEILGFNRPLSQLNKSQIQAVNQLIHNFSLVPSGTAGYKKAEVTRGGVDTLELDSKTMMSKRQPGLYFIGEVVDVTGWLGGYNFQWAWSSAYAAATSF